MRRPISKFWRHLVCERQYGTSDRPPPIIQIQGATFYRSHPNSTTAHNPPLFKTLNFELPSYSDEPEHWAIVGPSSSGKTTLLQVLQERHICVPPRSRTYPYLTSQNFQNSHQPVTPWQAIKYVGFDGDQVLGMKAPRSAYLSARFESRRESTDFSVLDYLRGDTELNPFDEGELVDPLILRRVLKDLNLEELKEMPVSNLSNGQTRRARIARALLSEPEVLLLDEPFMGLDPPTLLRLDPMLHRLASKNEPRLVLTLRPQDPVPEWITHVALLGGHCEMLDIGRKMDVVGNKSKFLRETKKKKESRDLAIGVRQVFTVVEPEMVNENDSSVSQDKEFLSRDGYPMEDASTSEVGEPLVEMEGVHVQYGSKSVLGKWKQTINGRSKDGLWWTVRRGERWGIFGPNGSGKTTILSLICSDHPQTYSLPIRLFGRSRLPVPGQRGISIFDIQARIGHSSPEIHNHIPRFLTLRQVLENAWSETFRGMPKLNADAHERVDACLRWFEQDLRLAAEPASKKTRVALFVRAVIKQPDIIILDEAFSGMDTNVRDRCLLFLAHGEHKEYKTPSSTQRSRQARKIVVSGISRAGRAKVGGLRSDQALLCISHVEDEIPGSIREWICLPESNTGTPARFGRLKGPIEGDKGRWNQIWGLGQGGEGDN